MCARAHLVLCPDEHERADPNELLQHGLLEFVLVQHLEQGGDGSGGDLSRGGGNEIASGPNPGVPAPVCVARLSLQRASNGC